MISYVLVHRFFSFDFSLVPHINVILSSKSQSFVLSFSKDILKIR